MKGELSKTHERYQHTLPQNKKEKTNRETVMNENELKKSGKVEKTDIAVSEKAHKHKEEINNWKRNKNLDTMPGDFNPAKEDSFINEKDKSGVEGIQIPSVKPVKGTKPDLENENYKEGFQMLGVKPMKGTHLESEKSKNNVIESPNVKIDPGESPSIPGVKIDPVQSPSIPGVKVNLVGSPNIPGVKIDPALQTSQRSVLEMGK